MSRVVRLVATSPAVRAVAAVELGSNYLLEYCLCEYAFLKNEMGVQGIS